MLPARASSANRSPSASPTLTRPPTTTGCVPPELAPGNPNAHFSFRRGTSSTVIPAALAGWKRVFVIVAPQPFQADPDSESRIDPTVLSQNADSGIGFRGSPPNCLPERYSASARRCARLRSAACAFIAPFSSASRICSGRICLRTSGLGAGELAATSWQVAQYVLKRTAPSWAYTADDEKLKSEKQREVTFNRSLTSPPQCASTVRPTA